MQTVIFGPFIGELGWEVVWWQGWVMKMCRGLYIDAHKIAVSTPGHKCLYPYVDEWWPLDFGAISRRNYVTDDWGRLAPRVKEWIEHHGKGAHAIYCPSFPCKAPDGLRFGASADGVHAARIPLSHQLLERIRPDPYGEAAVNRWIGPEARFVALFPRARKIRRPDKNWPKEKYDALIPMLQEAFPGRALAIMGDPAGAYYADGVPKGCLDCINIPDRLNVQAAILSRADLALGSYSGALLFAMACGTPSVIWGPSSCYPLYRDQNYLKTKMAYLNDPQPTPGRVMEAIQCASS